MIILMYTPLFKFFKSFLAFDLLLFFWGLSTAFSFLAHSQTHLDSSMNPVISPSRILSLKGQIPLLVSRSVQAFNTQTCSLLQSTHTAHTPTTQLLCACCVTLKLTVLNLCFLYTMVIGNGLQQHLKNTIILYNDI